MRARAESASTPAAETPRQARPRAQALAVDARPGAPVWTTAGRFIDSDAAPVRAFARRSAGTASSERERAVNLYYAVRDGIVYDPYYVGRDPRYFRASACLRARRGFCIAKAALLAAGARALGIPARVGFADVRNHLTTPKLTELIGGNLYRWHSYTELYLQGRWVKSTPAFDRSLCERFGVHALDFDGAEDSLFQEYNKAGDRHMEYVRERGSFADVPFETIVHDFAEHHPRWLANRES